MTLSKAKFQIIGVTGRKREGKDTVGGILHRRWTWGPVTGMAFADPLKVMAAELYGLTHEQLHGNEKETPLPAWNGLTPRVIMQRLGAEVARSIHPDTWVRHLLRRAEAWAAQFQDGSVAPLVIVTDVRYQNEARHIIDAGGEVWRVVRTALDAPLDPHPSEAEIPYLPVHETLYNSFGLNHLDTVVEAAIARHRQRAGGLGA